MYFNCDIFCLISQVANHSVICMWSCQKGCFCDFWVTFCLFVERPWSYFNTSFDTYVELVIIELNALFIFYFLSVCSYSYCVPRPVISCSLLPVSSQNKWMSLMYERKWLMCSYLTERHFQGFLYKSSVSHHGLLKCTQGLFCYVCKDVHTKKKKRKKIEVVMREHFLKNHEGSESWPLCV